MLPSGFLIGQGEVEQVEQTHYADLQLMHGKIGAVAASLPTIKPAEVHESGLQDLELCSDGFMKLRCGCGVFVELTFRVKSVGVRVCLSVPTQCILRRK